MPIPPVWSSESRTRVCPFLYLTVRSSYLNARSFQDLDGPLRSPLSTGRPSSNLTKTCKRSCKYTSVLSPLRGMQQPFPLKRRSLRKSCALIGSMVLAGGLCGFCLLVCRFFLRHICCMLFFLLMWSFQMEVVSEEYLLYMF